MVKRLSPYLIQLVQDAAHKSYWYKGSLKDFLRRSKVPGNLLGSLIESETKIQWLNFIFPKLEESEAGQRLIFEMARSLAEQKTFPDLVRHEDSARKIAEAKEAVKALKDRLDEYDRDRDAEKEAATVRKRGEEERAKTIKALGTLSDHKAGFEALLPQLGTTEGGYAFERWFYNFMDFCDVVNRRPYKRPDGRQVDGSITVVDTNYLVELKFTATAAEHDAIESLEKKIKGVADNTMGIVLSVSGFTEGTKNAASGDKTTLLLLDHSHLYLALTGAMPFADIVKRIGRHASQEGEAYLPVDKFGG